MDFRLSPISDAVAPALPYDAVTRMHLILTQQAYAAGREAFRAPRARLAELAGLSEATVSKVLRVLETAGFLDIRRPPPDARRAGATTQYRLKFFLSGPQPAGLARPEPTQEMPATRPKPERRAPNPTQPPRVAAAAAQPQQRRCDEPSSSAVAALASAKDHLEATRRAFDDDAFAAALAAAREGGEPTGVSDDDAALIRRVVADGSQRLAMPTAPETAARTAPAADYPAIGTNPEPRRRGGPAQIGETLANPVPTASVPTEDPARLARVKSAIGRIFRAASGNLDWARRVAAEVLWSATAGHLARFGDAALDVGTTLVAQNRWATPYGLADGAFSSSLRLVDEIAQGKDLRL